MKDRQMVCMFFLLLSVSACLLPEQANVIMCKSIKRSLPQRSRFPSGSAAVHTSRMLVSWSGEKDFSFGFVRGDSTRGNTPTAQSVGHPL